MIVFFKFSSSTFSARQLLLDQDRDFSIGIFIIENAQEFSAILLHCDEAVSCLA
jgi:hypothetical protein